MAEPTAAMRQALSKAGVAMPDGSFYIRNAGELSDAIKAVGRATPNGDESEEARRNSVRRHAMKRARALKLTNMIPDTWNSDGTLKHEMTVEEFLAHFGIKGMKWGRRKDGSVGSSHVSADSARTHELRATVKKHGVDALSNDDLQHLVSRMNLESQHSRLNPVHVSTGQKVLNDVLKIGGDVAKQQATVYAGKYAAKGIEHLIKNVG